jgi:Methane oxygenase PmoA
MPFTFPNCEVLPLPDHQVSFRVAGTERLRWHYDARYPRPFFFPLIGPAGLPLTRMGHPGAPDHDHHRSIWFAHHKVQGVDFWGDRTTARVRQKMWLAYQDGEAAQMAVLLGWYDGHDPKELMEQELVVSVQPRSDGEVTVELQSVFKPAGDSLELQKTNFGFLAVRVAKSLSAHFGGGQLTGSEGNKGEANLFGKPAKWMDYSGPVRDGVLEGITFFDHPENPGHPVHWHVREDGWMGAAPCLTDGITITRAKPLRLRYLLHAHRGEVNPRRAGELLEEFGKSPQFVVKKAVVKHTAWSILRG